MYLYNCLGDFPQKTQTCSERAIFFIKPTQERFFFILSLWPYTIPLLFVYFSEYATLGQKEEIV